MRLRQTEFRYSTKNQKHEIVMYHEVSPGQIDPETCYTVAQFIRTNEGFDMVTVGGRFFKTRDNFIVAKHAIAFLYDLFDITNGDVSA